MKRQCLIAGLPDSGKSTYIAALSYLLEHPVDNQQWILGNKAFDKTVLNKLSQPWMKVEEVDRTTQGIINSLDFDIIQSTKPNEHLLLNLPDMAGETFASLIMGTTEGFDTMEDSPDCLLYFIRKMPRHVLIEDLTSTDEEKAEPNTQKIEFTIQSISPDIQNILLLKELVKMYGISKLCIILSCWDERENEEKPKETLKANNPFLYNYINYRFPNSPIYGLSAQGAEYLHQPEQTVMLLNKTREGTRCFVKLDDNISHDITLPLTHLL